MANNSDAEKATLVSDSKAEMDSNQKLVLQLLQNAANQNQSTSNSEAKKYICEVCGRGWNDLKTFKSHKNLYCGGRVAVKQESETETVVKGKKVAMARVQPRVSEDRTEPEKSSGTSAVERLVNDIGSMDKEVLNGLFSQFLSNMVKKSDDK